MASYVLTCVRVAMPCLHRNFIQTYGVWWSTLNTGEDQLKVVSYPMNRELQWNINIGNHPWGKTQPQVTKKMNCCLSLFNIICLTLQWHHNELECVSNHQRMDCLLNCLFMRRSKKTPKLRVTGLCEGNSPHKGPVTRKMFPFDDVIMGYLKLMLFWQ